MTDSSVHRAARRTTLALLGHGPCRPPPPADRSLIAATHADGLEQLLSQKLPRCGYGPTACPTPPDCIRLEPPPGLLRGSHRCAGGGLRGCTQLGSLAAELGQGHGTAGAGGSGDQGHLVGLLRGLLSMVMAVGVVVVAGCHRGVSWGGAYT